MTLAFSYFYFSAQHARYKDITTFEECVKGGFEVLATYPEQCKMPGKTFVNPAQEKQKEPPKALAPKIEDSFQNLSYFIEGQKFSLENGIGLIPSNTIPGKATSTIGIVETPALFDINNDFSPDIIFLLKSVELSTKRTLYYISSAVTLNTGYSGLNALYIGQMVASSTFTHKNGEIVLRYNDEKGAQQTKYFVLQNDILKELSH